MVKNEDNGKRGNNNRNVKKEEKCINDRGEKK